jgi:hypothetical protein
MQRKRPTPRRFLSPRAPEPPARDQAEDDPWAGEDVDWQAEGRQAHEERDAHRRFFRGVTLALVLSAPFWVGVALLLVWLL